MALTPKQAWAIAHLVVELRPDWQAEGVVSALKRCADKPPAIVALAAIRAAADDNARTPGVIPTPGTHWDEGIKSQPRTSFNIPCPEHAGEILPCGRCAANRVPAPLAGHFLAQARAELQAARRGLCSHGIAPTTCREPHPTTDHQPAEPEEQQ